MSILKISRAALLTALFAAAWCGIHGPSVRADEPPRPVVPGGEIPTPFSDMNRKVELADGEVYDLIGRVVFPAAEPYLHVDLASHPWLENKRRASNPLYPLVTDDFDWKTYEGAWLTVQVKAEGRIVNDAQGHPTYDLYLVPLMRPTAYDGDPPGAGQSPVPTP
jgi:hypothetical protein